MKPKTATHHRHWVLRLFEWAVLVCVVQLLIGIFLQRIEGLQADAERLAFQGVVNSLKAAATFASLRQWEFREGDNPVGLLEQAPNNYLGELAEADVEQEGVWYFDPVEKLLVYRKRTYNRTASALGRGKSSRFKLMNAGSADQKSPRLAIVPVET